MNGSALQGDNDQTMQTDPAGTAPILLANAVPKSGTYMVDAIIRATNLYCEANLTVMLHCYNEIKADGSVETHFQPLQRTLAVLRPGFAYPGHLGYTPEADAELGRLVNQRKFMHVFTYRDPRDIVISYANYITHSKVFSAQNEHNRTLQTTMWEKYSTDDERISHWIKNHRELNLVGYEPWRHSRFTHAFRFEDLFADLIALKSGRLGAVFERLLSSISSHATAEKRRNDERAARELFGEIYGQGPTAQPGMDKIARYKRVFTDGHWQLAQDYGLDEVVRIFGYDWEA